MHVCVCIQFRLPDLHRFLPACEYFCVSLFIASFCCALTLCRIFPLFLPCLFCVFICQLVFCVFPSSLCTFPVLSHFMLLRVAFPWFYVCYPIRSSSVLSCSTFIPLDSLSFLPAAVLILSVIVNCLLYPSKFLMLLLDFSESFVILPPFIPPFFGIYFPFLCVRLLLGFSRYISTPLP